LENERIGADPSKTLAGLPLALSAEILDQRGQQRDRRPRSFALRPPHGERGVGEIHMRPRERKGFGNAERPVEEDGGNRPVLVAQLPEQRFDFGQGEVAGLALALGRRTVAPVKIAHRATANRP
jgi:hypothetical protein